MKNKIILIIAILIISCSSNENKMIVLGNVDGLKKGTLYLQAEKDSLVVNLDSVYLRGGGNYKLITNIKEPDIYYLYLDKEYDLPAADKKTDSETDNEFLGKKIQHAIDKLPENFKTVAILRDVQELSYDDISNILNVPLGTVKSRINRARIQLQEELKNFL